MEDDVGDDGRAARQADRGDARQRRSDWDSCSGGANGALRAGQGQAQEAQEVV